MLCLSLSLSKVNIKKFLKNVYLLLKFFFNVYLFLRERQRGRGEGPEREGDKESEAGSRLHAVSTETSAGLKLTNHEIVT